MSTFKEGQKVRVKDIAKPRKFRGEIFTIDRQTSDCWFEGAWEVEEVGCWFLEDELELVGEEQGQPTPEGKGEAVTPLVIEDLRQRDEKGQAEYGESLRAQNGRNAAQDAYEEVLDLAQYMKQVLLEREKMHRDILAILSQHAVDGDVIEQVNTKLYEYGF